MMTSMKLPARNKPKNPPAWMIPFFKMPLFFYRLGLGRLLGGRFMRLTHRGRRSGKIYHSVLAVLRCDPATREIYVVSPWAGSNWYRNLQAGQAVEVETGSIHYAPDFESLPPERIANLFIEFRQRYPFFSRVVARIPGWKIDSSYEEFLTLARGLRGVVFRPKSV